MRHRQHIVYRRCNMNSERSVVEVQNKLGGQPATHAVTWAEHNGAGFEVVKIGTIILGN